MGEREELAGIIMRTLAENEYSSSWRAVALAAAGAILSRRHDDEKWEWREAEYAALSAPADDDILLELVATAISKDAASRNGQISPRGAAVHALSVYRAHDPERREMLEALESSERKLSAYVGVCNGDKELTNTVLPLVRAVLSKAKGEAK